MSCYTGFFNVRRGWQSLNTGPRFYLRLIRRTGWLWIYTSRITDGRPFKQKKLSVPFLYAGVPAGLTPFRELVPLGRRNWCLFYPRHTLWEGGSSVEIPSNSIKYAKIWFIDIQVLEYLIVQDYNFPQNSINICFHIIFSHCLRKLDVQTYCYSQIIL